MSKKERIAELELQLAEARGLILQLQGRVLYLEGQIGRGPYYVPVNPPLWERPWTQPPVIC